MSEQILIAVIKKVLSDIPVYIQQGIKDVMESLKDEAGEKVLQHHKDGKYGFSVTNLPDIQRVKVENFPTKEVEQVEVINPQEIKFPSVQKVEVVNPQKFPEFPTFPKIEIPKEISLSKGSADKSQYVVLVDKYGEPIDFESILFPYFEQLKSILSSINTQPLGGASYGGGGQTPKFHEDIKTFDGTDNTMVLTSEPKTNSLQIFIGEGGGTTKQTQGASRDYTISGRIITFNLSAAQLSGLIAVADYVTLQ